jgi:hypothetical protein
MPTTLERFRYTLTFTAGGRDQQNRGRSGHFTGTCVVYAPEASGRESMAINVPPA